MDAQPTTSIATQSGVELPVEGRELEIYSNVLLPYSGNEQLLNLRHAIPPAEATMMNTPNPFQFAKGITIQDLSTGLVSIFWLPTDKNSLVAAGVLLIMSMAMTFAALRVVRCLKWPISMAVFVMVRASLFNYVIYVDSASCATLFASFAVHDATTAERERATNAAECCRTDQNMPELGGNVHLHIRCLTTIYARLTSPVIHLIVHIAKQQQSIRRISSQMSTMYIKMCESYGGRGDYLHAVDWVAKTRINNLCMYKNGRNNLIQLCFDLFSKITKQSLTHRPHSALSPHYFRNTAAHSTVVCRHTVQTESLSITIIYSICWAAH